MPINTPSYGTIVNRIRADIANALPDVDPTIYGSFVNAFAISNAGRHYDSFILIQQLIKELFPQTASGEFLERWAQYDGLYRLAATPGRGYITVTGTIGTTIPALTEWRTTDNLLLSSLSSAILAAETFTLSSLSRSSTTVTGITSTAHTFSTGQTITIAGAVETDYNGDWEIIVVDTDEFTFEITTTPTTPATGTITASYDGASIEVEANEPGEDSNLSSGAQLQVTTPIVGLDTDAYVQYLGLTGGGNIEDDDSLRERVFYSRANPVSNFNESAIILQAKTISGVTRVFVNRITPAVGQVTIAFMRDNDVDPIPDAGEVIEVRDAILEILPATSAYTDVFVQAPTPVEVDFTFTDLVPNTSTMRQAITDNLTAFFSEEANYESDILEVIYNSVIVNTIDTATGESIDTFTLSTPGGDVSISTGEIGVLGSITYP